MKLVRNSAFGALLSPTGIHVVEYRTAAHGPRVLRYTRDLAPVPSVEAGAQRLAELLEASGARGRPVSLAVSGFGSCHQILSLPPAPADILRPVVKREMRRFFPDLFASGAAEPIVEFVAVDPPAAGGQAPGRDLLVAAVPPALMDAVAGALAARGIALEHWTILPRAMERLFEVFDGREESVVLVLMVPQTPLVGLFHQGKLRLFSEPTSRARPSGDTETQTVLEQIERGSLFLHQQFRGATVERVLVAAEAEATPATLAEIRSRQALPVEHFGLEGYPPGALAALGAALDASSADGLTLLPADLRPMPRSERWTRRLAVASAAVLIAAAGWWAWSATRAEADAASRLEALRADLASRTSAMAEVQPLVAQRRAHTQRATLLELLAGSQHRLPEALWPLQAVSPTIEVRSLQIQRQEGGWQVALTATAHGQTSADATDAVDALFQLLTAQLADGDVALNQLSYAPPPAEGAGQRPGPIAVTFEMSFIVPIARKPQA